MPTYEYECRECGHTFETFQSMTELPLTDCPLEQCGAKGSLRRLIGAGAGLIFKGSGFYITDYKNKGGEKSESASKSDAKSDSKTDSAPSKPESKPAASTPSTPTSKTEG